MRSRTARQVTRNTVYLGISNTVQTGLAFFTGVVVARVLGADALGVYGLASAVGQIGYRVADAGIPTILTRHFSRSVPQASDHLVAGMAFRVWSGLIVLLFIEIFAIAVGYSIRLQMALVIYSGSTVIAGLRNTAASVYYGRQLMRHPAMAEALFRVTSFVLTVFFVLVGFGVVWTIVALLIGQAAATFYLASGPERDAALLPLRAPRSSIIELLTESYPIAIAGVFTMLNFRVDAVVLSLYVDEAELGFYNAAYAVIIGLALFPNSFLRAVFPAISQRFHESKSGAVRLFLRSQFVNTSVGALVGVAVMVNAVLMVDVIYGSGYESSSSLLSILAWALLFMYVSHANLVFFNSTNNQQLTLYIAVVAGTVNIMANVLLVPRLGVVGAAWATVLSEAILFVSSSILVLFVIRGFSRQRVPNITEAQT